MHAFDQYPNRVGRCVLADAMTEVEDMRRSHTRAHVRPTKAFQYFDGFCLDLRFWRKQRIGIQIALQSFARRTSLPSYQGACPAQRA